MALSPIQNAIAVYAKAVKAAIAARPTNAELALAPSFKRLVEDGMRALFGKSDVLPTIVPEYSTPSIGRPDLAFVRPGQPPRAFIELKEPDKPIDPARLKGHDKRQFSRFISLPLWAFSNFHQLTLYRRGRSELETTLVPKAAFDPAKTEAETDRLIASHPTGGFEDILARLVNAQPLVPANAQEIAASIAHASALVRDIIQDRLVELSAAPAQGHALHLVRDEFRDVLYAHPKAAGYPERDFNELFASAFAQTLAFGLLLVREATGDAIDRYAHRHMSTAHPLLRATLRALLEEEIIEEMGAGFDVMRDAINLVDPAKLARAPGGHDPILYFYEDFLAVFDPAARRRHGVFYTPVDVVQFQVAAMNRCLHSLGTSGLLDEGVTVLDPACGTGTYLIATAACAAGQAAARFGPGMVQPALASLAGRLFGFELLVGPYAVAHYRLHKELDGIGVPPSQRLNIFLTDTLAEPGAASPVGHLGMISNNIVQERHLADRLKTIQPILAIIANPPYRRLKAGETEELVGQWMAGIWEDLKTPVQEEGWGGELNTFPDLYIAFWRWALWKLFERPGADGRGVVSFITNRTFLTGHPYAGLRAMMRSRFDRIEIIDLQGDLRAGRRAGIMEDEGVFDIQAGTAITIAWSAGGAKAAGHRAEVSYADCWRAGCFTRAQKLAWLQDAAAAGSVAGVAVDRAPLEDFRPVPFAGLDWPSVSDCFLFQSSGMQTKRDHLVYGFSLHQIEIKIREFLAASPEDAERLFHSTSGWTATKARHIPFSSSNIHATSYRPLDLRSHYRHERYGDRLRPSLQEAWGTENFCLYAMPSGTGAGPAAWAHALLPDYHAFSGRGGYAFPLWDRRPGQHPCNIRARLLDSLAEAYGAPADPLQVFDAMLCLLSAKSYTARFADDLADAFPHVPFPAERDVFAALAGLGAQIRGIETWSMAPEPRFAAARVQTAPRLPLGPARCRNPAGESGAMSFALCEDGSGVIGPVSEEIWEFEVSGYKVLQKFLAHREGLSIDAAFLTEVLDVIARIAMLIALMDQADALLVRSLACSYRWQDAIKGAPHPITRTLKA